MGYNQEENPKKDPPTKEIQAIIMEKFKPYVELWNLIYSWKDLYSLVYSDAPMMELANESTKAKITFDDKFGTASKFNKFFKEMAMEAEEGCEPKALVVANSLFEEMKEFNIKFMPIVEFLGIEAIKEEHWAELLINTKFIPIEDEHKRQLEFKLLPEDTQAELVEANGPMADDKPSAASHISGEENDLDAVMSIKLKHLVTLDAQANINLIEEMSIKAQKQFKIEVDIRKIKKMLVENDLVIEKYKVSMEGVQF